VKAPFGLSSFFCALESEHGAGQELRAVVFDMDGVIIDSEPLWSEAERQLLARRNLAYSSN